jgi:hypothetical protein
VGPPIGLGSGVGLDCREARAVVVYRCGRRTLDRLGKPLLGRPEAAH